MVQPMFHWRRSGFSLIELLVVIAIVGILMALLVPMIGGVRRQADSTNCTSNLRQIGTAIQTRAAERGGYAPLAGTIIVPASLQGSEILSAAVGDTARTRYDYLPNLGSVLGETVGPFQVALAKYLGVKDPVATGYVPPHELLSKWEVFRCIRARPRYPSSTTFLIQFEGSYALNAMQSIPMDFVLNDAVFGYGRDRLAGKLSKIDNPSRTLLLADGAPLYGSVNIGDGTPLYWSPSSDTSRPLTLRDAFDENGRVTSQIRLFDPDRHSNRANVLCADGHVDSALLTPVALTQVILANW